MNNLSLSKQIKLITKYPKTSLTLLAGIVLRRKTISFPRMIGFYVTNVCNLNCSMCLNAKYRKNHYFNSNITLEQVKKIMPELKQYKPLIWFSGGEPLVNPDMISIIQLFTKEGLCTSLTTNGFVLAHFAKAIAKSGLDFISLSLDSDVAHEHDQGRGIKGSFDRLIKGLKLLQKERKLTGTPINIKINSVVKKTNFYKLLRMYDFIESLGVDEWRLQHISYLTPQADKIITKYIKRTGIGEGYTGELISQENYLSTKEVLILSNQLEKIEERSKIYKTRIAIEPKVHDLKAYYQGKWPSKESFCNPAFHQLTIYENGKIGAGCLAYQIGDIYDGRTLKQTWNSQKALFFRNLIKKNKYIPPCFRCCSLNYFF